MGGIQQWKEIRDKYAHCAGLLTGLSSNLYYIHKSTVQLADQATNGQDILPLLMLRVLALY